ncbi:MAG: hypothetical protein ACRBG0_01170 [Lewinella sp.]|uniref:hypothetical protein n=1 Tax=Lewinella sp. TaxID=2004506 RepID=UPI003D6A69BF
MENLSRVVNAPKEQSLELLNNHHTLDAHMYQAMKMLHGSEFSEEIDMAAGRQLSMSRSRNLNKISAKAYIWGFHIAIPEKPLQELLKATDITAAVIALGGAGFGAGGVPPIAAVAAVLAGIIGLERAVIQSIDGGKGVYLSWSWIQVPFMFSPPYVGVQPVITRIKR